MDKWIEVIEVSFLDGMKNETREFFLERRRIKPFAVKHHLNVLGVSKGFITKEDYNLYFGIEGS
jgi:hypothetical protein